jgi:formylglycine-generating enzyme required for sulfatase activity/serine/threonine protein kinase
MDSRAPTHLTDETLSLYALGKTDDLAAESVSRHLAKCSDCRRRAAELSTIRSAARTNTAAHPADETLVSYGLGDLEDTMTETVSRHLQKCNDCRRRVAELSSVGRPARKSQSRLEPAAQPEKRPEKSGDSQAGSGSKRSSEGTLKGLPEGLADHPQYEVQRELGRGAIGIVYLARNKLMDRLEVLKVLTREMLSREGTSERFLREIQSAARLSHPNVVAAHSAFQVGDLLVFSMEYVEGSDLAKLVRERGPLPVVNACYFAYQAAQGLQHAHERGMIHRDIKPSNLILYRQGKKAVVKILDFGLAKAASERNVEASLTHEGQMLGTPDYIAPEQTLDAQKADIRADIYSLGCTLYHLLAGRPPFGGSSLYEILQSHHSVEAQPLNEVRPEVPADLAAVVAKMMAKKPADRYQTPAEVVDALKPFLKLEAPRAGTIVETDDTIRQSLLAGLKNASESGPGEATADFQSGATQVEGPAAGRPKAKGRSGSAPTLPAQSVAGATKSRSRSGATIVPAGGRTSQTSKKRPLLSATAWIWTGVSVAAVLLGIAGAWLGGAFTTKSNDKDTVAKSDDQGAPRGNGPQSMRNNAPNNAMAVGNPSQDPSAQGAAQNAARQGNANAGMANGGVANGGVANGGMGTTGVTNGAMRPDDPRFSRRSQLQGTNGFASRSSANQAMNPMLATERDDNAVLMKLVRLSNGEFMMGDKPEEGGPGSTGQVPARLSKEFWIGKYEVTQLQWRQVMQTMPWAGQTDVKQGNDQPATFISWDEAVEFCEKLSEDERGAGRLPYGMKYVLPSEAQWEYACRAGTATRFCCGDDESQLVNFAWFAKNAADGGQNQAHAVGQRQPNPRGLFDMHGNVAEWCRDADGPPLLGGIDPETTSGGPNRMSRGGSFADVAADCRSAARRAYEPTHRDRTLGFRVALCHVPRMSLRQSPLGLAGTTQRPGLNGRLDPLIPSYSPLPTPSAMGRAVVPPVELREDNGLKLKLVHIAPGSFHMGGVKVPTAQSGLVTRVTSTRGGRTIIYRRHVNQEVPTAPAEGSVDVSLSSEFWLGKDEVTQAQWQQVMHSTPWRGKSQVMEGANFAATFVSWNEATSFCKKFTDQERQAGRLQTSWKYALPTEAQWEYACSAGTEAPYSVPGNQFQLARYAWYGALEANGSARREPFAHEVGRKRQNPWGIDDMHGNVCEWCRDRFKDKLPGGTDPEITAGSSHVVRGGGWATPAAMCTSSARASYAASTRRNDLGFRVAIISTGAAAPDEQAAPAKKEEAQAKTAPEKASPAKANPAPVEKSPAVAVVTPGKTERAAKDSSAFAGNRAGQIREDNGLKTMLVWIPAGSFTMGSPPDRDHRQNEGPVEVTLTNGFWLTKYEVTQSEWQRVMQTTPWKGEPYVKNADDIAASYVTWDDATAFCTRLTKDERDARRLPADWEYRLPTEAQWEYACRAGTTTPYSFGKAVSGLADNAWFTKNASNARLEHANEVGGKNGNAWGLHDMHGNVSEWCRDWYVKDLPGGADPEVTIGGPMRALRGGGWRSTAEDCRTPFRQGANPGNKNPAWGFRIAAVRTGK